MCGLLRERAFAFERNAPAFGCHIAASPRRRRPRRISARPSRQHRCPAQPGRHHAIANVCFTTLARGVPASSLLQVGDEGAAADHNASGLSRAPTHRHPDGSGGGDDPACAAAVLLKLYVHPCLAHSVKYPCAHPFRSAHTPRHRHLGGTREASDQVSVQVLGVCQLCPCPTHARALTASSSTCTYIKAASSRAALEAVSRGLQHRRVSTPPPPTTHARTRGACGRAALAGASKQTARVH